MHLVAVRIRRALALALLGAVGALALPQPAAASYAWGAVQVPGCSWAAALPAVCGTLDVHSNGTDFGYANGDSGWGLRWQCVELAQRWTNLAYGETYNGGNHWGVSAAYQMWNVWGPANRADQANYSVPFIQQPNGGQSPPQFGDLMIFAPTAGDQYGHVAIVSGMEQGYVDLVEENWSADSGSARIPIVGNTVPDRGSFHVYGWLRAANAHSYRSLSRNPAHVWSGLNADGSVQAALLGTDSGVWYTRGSGAAFSGPATYGGTGVSAPTAVEDAAGRLELFVTGADHDVTRYLPPANSGVPGSTPVPGTWTSLGGRTPGKPAVVKAADGHLELFIRGLDGVVSRNHELTPGGSWSGWSSVGGIILSDPSVTIGPDGNLGVFGIGQDRGLWWWHQGPGTSSAWSSLGGIAVGAPQLVQLPGNKLGAFLVGQDNGVWYRLQTSATSWADWQTLGGIILGDPTLVKDALGNAEVLVVGTDGAMWVKRQSAPGTWGGWTSAGGYMISDISGQRDGAGRLEVFAIGRSRDLVHSTEATPDGVFSTWSSLGGIWLLP